MGKHYPLFQKWRLHNTWESEGQTSPWLQVTIRDLRGKVYVHEPMRSAIRSCTRFGLSVGQGNTLPVILLHLKNNHEAEHHNHPGAPSLPLDTRISPLDVDPDLDPEGWAVGSSFGSQPLAQNSREIKNDLGQLYLPVAMVRRLAEAEGMSFPFDTPLRIRFCGAIQPEQSQVCGYWAWAEPGRQWADPGRC